MANKSDGVQWIENGKALIPKAEAELAAGNYAMSAFYSNQAADTIIKGIMLSVTGNELTGHSLATNCRQTSHFHKKLMTVFGDCARMERFYFDQAAGAKVPTVSKEEAEQALASAKKMPLMV